MPARVKRQSEEIKDLFREKITEKVAREKERLRQQIDEDVPSWLSWAVKPLAGSFERERARDEGVGRVGERGAALSF